MSCGQITRGSIPCCDESTVSSEGTFDPTFDFTFQGSGQAVECSMPVAGTRARLILINYKHVVKIYTSDIGVITSIVLSGPAYEFLGFRNDVKKSDEVIKTSNSKRRFKHHVSFVIYELDQLQKRNIIKLAKGRFVAIVENNGKGPDSIELLGRECGLKMMEGQIRNAHENGGLYIIDLSTPGNGIEFERKLPQTVGGSYSEGLTIIEDLLNALTVDATDITVDSDMITSDQTIR